MADIAGTQDAQSVMHACVHLKLHRQVQIDPTIYASTSFVYKLKRISCVEIAETTAALSA